MCGFPSVMCDSRLFRGLIRSLVWLRAFDQRKAPQISRTMEFRQRRSGKRGLRVNKYQNFRDWG